MSAASDPSKRLSELERILERARTAIVAASGDTVDPAALHLASAPVERIRRLTEELRSSPEHDEISTLTARMLVDDCATAIAHFRAAGRLAAARIEAAAGPIHEVREFARQEAKLLTKGSRRSEEPPPGASS